MSELPVRLFLVDDNQIDLIVNEKLLRLARVSDAIHTFQSGRSFLAHIREQQDLHDFRNVVLLDIMMPGFTGFELVEELDRLPEPVRSAFEIYMLSSSIDRRDIRRAGELPLVRKVLEKPLDTWQLKTLLFPGQAR